MPCVGHESRAEHNRCSQCLFYAVFSGFVRGVYTNSWLAREQTEHYTDSRQKSFKWWDEAVAWWTAMCTVHHQNGCPPFEPVTFSLNPSSTTHPSSPPPCTRAPEPDAGADATASSTASAAPAAASTANAGPFITAQAAHAGVASSSRPFPVAAPPPSTLPPPSGLPHLLLGQLQSRHLPSKKEDPTTPHLNLRVPPITMQTRIQLTPTGQARGLALAAARADDAAARADDATARAEAVVAQALATPAATGATPAATATAHPQSVLVTPAPLSAAAAAAPPPAPANPRHVRQYGIRGVAVFYSSYAAARAAATLLGLEDDSKIMVSDNHEKLEAWMTGKPFVGEDS
ncbi:hypothetical protein B0H13DRAFT_1874447 [Mycena leptocephala]|nr:hypothetical protein B0H13DRAFT_1874447 [Mycena leptocephala]